MNNPTIMNNPLSTTLSATDKNIASIDMMNRMHLWGMVNAFEENLRSTNPEPMTIDGFVYWLLTRESDFRANQAIQRLIKQAGFRYKAYLEEIDYTIERNLNRNQLERLASLNFIHDGQNVFLTGSSGTGKSFIATALGYQACKQGIRTYYASAPKLLAHLKLAKAKGTLETEMKKIEKCPLLILDDLFLVGLDAKERAILVDIIEDRHNRKSIIITSQLPVADWYDAIGEPTVADAILDRIVHTAHRIELVGESVRKLMTKKG